MTQTSGNAKTGLLAAGVIAIVVGVLAAAGLWYSATQRYDDAVRGLARAPVGCDTTLDFAKTGTYQLFVETSGSITNVAGDCDAVTEYGSNPDDVPSVALMMWDPNSLDLAPDLALELGRDSTTTYDSAGFVGQSIRSVEITTAGDHVLRVESSSTDFAIAVGRDPNEGVALLKAAAVLALLLGVVAGVVLIVASTRRRGADDAAPDWPHGGNEAWVTTPPVAMPFPAKPDWQPAAGPPSAIPHVPGQPPLSGQPPLQAPSPPVPRPAAPQPAQDPLPSWVPTAPSGTPTRPLGVPPTSEPSDDDRPSPWAPPADDRPASR